MNDEDDLIAGALMLLMAGSDGLWFVDDPNSDMELEPGGGLDS